MALKTTPTDPGRGREPRKSPIAIVPLSVTIERVECEVAKLRQARESYGL